ncbi:hypothetical protein PUN28_007941 [Cardiocondyla obscurior]|uniref:Uncharacterized protein n=1 Tax=Cardiocondyla obscurior TaxID=286306 RepID=A0AAW2G167_9HYME
MPRRTPPSCRSASQPQPFVPIRSIAVLPSFVPAVSRPRFRSSPDFTPARPPSPLSPPSRNPITPRATSYVQQPNPHTRARLALSPPSPPLPRDQIDSVRVSFPRTFVFRFLSRLSNAVPAPYRLPPPPPTARSRGGLVPKE